MERTGLYTKIKDMEVGAVVVVSVDDYSYNTVRRYASDFGLVFDRRYTCHVDRATRTYTITRKS